MMQRVLLFVVLLPAALLNAQETAPPIVRATLTPETVTVGEPAELRITVLTTTWFPQAPEFPSFELPNALVRLPANSSRATSETIDGERWNGVTRRYQVYPLMGARFQLGGLELKVTVADPGKASRNYELVVPELELLATVPRGAEGLDPFIAGTSFSIHRTVDADPDQLEIGSAVVITYTAELEGLHAMFIPPLSPPIDSAGVSVYGDTPVVEDAAVAKRVEKMTLVFEAGGTFTVPGTRLDWWNTATGTVETASLPTVTLEVAGPPLPDDAADEGVDEPGDAGWPRIAMSLLLVVALAVWLGPGLLARFRLLRDAHRASEGYAFRRLRKALRRQDERDVQHALFAWLSKLEPELNSHGFAQEFGDPDLQRNLEAIDRNLHGPAGSGAVPFTDIEQGLINARQRYLAQRKASSRVSLPPLNPGGTSGQ